MARSKGPSLSAPLTGPIGSAARRAGSGAEMTSLTIEFGTYAVREVLRALQADTGLHCEAIPIPGWAVTSRRKSA